MVCVQLVGPQKAPAPRLVIHKPVGLAFNFRGVSCQDNQSAHDIIFKRGREGLIRRKQGFQF